MIEEYWLAEFLLDASTGPAAVAIDVGANAGSWSRELAAVFGEVVALEPDYRARECFRLRGMPVNCTLLPFAAGAMPAVERFRLREGHEQSSLVDTHPVGAGGMRPSEVVDVREVSVVTLDQIAALYRWPRVDFVKIDVEGSEADVLAGVTSDVFRDTKFLIELHDTDRATGLQLERLGRDKIKIAPHPHAKAHPKHKWVYSTP